jgi:hypothetical protein
MDYLKSTELIDYNTIEIQNIIEEFKTGDSSDKQKAIALYLKIRDGRRYNPYKLCFEADCYKASNIAKKKGWTLY